MSIAQQDPYQDETLFTVGDVAPQELAYGESAWAISPISMEPVRDVRQPRAFSGNYILNQFSAPDYGYYHAGTWAPSLLDYTVMEGLGIDFESEKGRKILAICAYHAQPTEHSIQANIKAAKLIEEWLTPSELAQLREEHKVMIKSKEHKKRTYIVHENPSSRVEVWEGGKCKMRACGVVEESGFVQGDKFLSKVMAIKTDEDDYLKRSSLSRGP